MKKITAVHNAPEGHWVGDGFPVRSLFTYEQAESVSPFLLLDYAGPAQFEAAGKPRGVGEHPHRGFETVTIVYQGEVAHRDSTGSGGLIGPGDVQWMTAAAGIIHEEFHSESFTRSGGMLEMVQLWVNLPANDKLSPPRYQTLLKADIPVVGLPDNAGTLRVIAGAYDNATGPAKTFTSINVWDLNLEQGAVVSLAVPENHNTLLISLQGEARVNSTETLQSAEYAAFDREGEDILIEQQAAGQLLLLSGEPIDEPVVAHGPFVMNSVAEIQQAIADFRSGRFGQIPSA